MRNRVVMYSVAGVVAVGLLAVSAFKSRPPVSDSVALIAATVSSPRHSVANHTVAKTARPVAKAAAPVESQLNTGPLPRTYAVLLTHCLFSAKPAALAGQRTAPTDSDLTLRGVLQQGRGFVAYIENTTSHQAQEVHVGDAVGPGKLIAIDLYSVRFTASGRDMRIRVGESFSGAHTVATAETSALSNLRHITE